MKEIIILATVGLILYFIQHFHKSHLKSREENILNLKVLRECLDSAKDIVSSIDILGVRRGSGLFI